MVSVIAVAGAGTALATPGPWRPYGGQTSQGAPVYIGVEVTRNGILKGVDVQIGIELNCRSGATTRSFATFRRVRLHFHHNGQVATFHEHTAHGGTATVNGRMTRAHAHGTLSVTTTVDGQSCKGGPVSWSARSA